MDNLLQSFILTFVPLFIVIDALGNLPFVISLSEGMSRGERRKMIHIATVTATIVGLVFLFLGQLILYALDISVGSFAIAGGLILLILSIKYMTTGRMVEAIKRRNGGGRSYRYSVDSRSSDHNNPFATGNSVSSLYGSYLFHLNMLITWAILLSGNQIVRFMGKGGLKAVSRVFSLLLAAIAVNMIIHGLELADLLPGKAM